MLPWALKILMIALVTVAVFIYRKPFQHLFSAVGYGTIGSTERAEYSLREASHTFRRSTLDAATVAVPGMAAYRAARWARRNPGQAATVAAGAAAGVAAGTATGAAAATEAAGATAAQADGRRCLRVAAAAGRATPGRRGRRGERQLPPGRRRGQRRGSRVRPGPGQERDRGGRCQRAGRPAARPAAQARLRRGQRDERVEGSGRTRGRTG